MRRVIVTRPAREAAHWVQELQSRGIAAAALPLIAIRPASGTLAEQALQQARDTTAQYRALMFVSSNAVLHFFQDSAPNSPLALMGKAPTAIKTRVWSPGPGTAHSLQRAGVPPELIDGPADDAAQFDSEALWHRVAPQIQPGDRVLVVRGRSAAAADAVRGTGRDWLARQIEAAGGRVDFVAAYERGVPWFGPNQVALAQQAAHDGSLWLFSSSEAITHLVQALPTATWSAAHALATHPRIAETARTLGFGTVRECRPALSDVVASIESAG
jgi:uroporphyrinogen-III synthase